MSSSNGGRRGSGVAKISPEGALGALLFRGGTTSVESQNGAITIQRYSVENQKGAIAIDIVQP